MSLAPPVPQRIGFVVNPIAGMGARVGLKGTDGMVEEARKRGAKAESQARAARFLRALPEAVELVTAAGTMGEGAAEDADRSVMIAYTPGEETSAADTNATARALAEWGVDLIVFVGGDGTARDILTALRESDAPSIPILGIPAGSKMYSSVFADTPEHGAVVAASHDDTREGEVLDIDEAAFREGSLRVTLHGLALVPHHRYMQGGKLAGADDEVEQESLAAAVCDILSVEPGVHILGAGGTMMQVKVALGIAGTLLGIDAVRVDEAGAASMVAADATEADLLRIPDVRSITLSPIGGQGFILGRGNLPISSVVLARAGIDRVRVIATPSKLIDTPSLHVDTGDPAWDRAFPKWIRAVTGHNATKLVKVTT